MATQYAAAKDARNRRITVRAPVVRPHGTPRTPPLARIPAPGTPPERARGARHAPVFLAAFAAFAAAFISCLCARTFTSDSGPVMSATERKDSSSPYA